MDIITPTALLLGGTWWGFFRWFLAPWWQKARQNSAYRRRPFMIGSGILMGQLGLGTGIIVKWVNDALKADELSGWFYIPYILSLAIAMSITTIQGFRTLAKIQFQSKK